MKCTNCPHLCFEHCSLSLTYCLKRNGNLDFILLSFQLSKNLICKPSPSWFSLGHCFAASLWTLLNKLGIRFMGHYRAKSHLKDQCTESTCLGCVWGRFIDWSQEDTNNLPECHGSLAWLIRLSDDESDLSQWSILREKDILCFTMIILQTYNQIIQSFGSWGTISALLGSNCTKLIDFMLLGSQTSRIFNDWIAD